MAIVYKAAALGRCRVRASYQGSCRSCSGRVEVQKKCLRYHSKNTSPSIASVRRSFTTAPMRFCSCGR